MLTKTLLKTAKTTELGRLAELASRHQQQAVSQKRLVRTSSSTPHRMGITSGNMSSAAVRIAVGAVRAAASPRS